MSGKVFCIGFHKTGTTTMMHVLTELGYRVTGPNGVDSKNLARILGPLTVALSGRYDAFQDNPWPLVYREMDALHPGSKFILTIRDEQKWYNSFGNLSFSSSRTSCRASRRRSTMRTSISEPFRGLGLRDAALAATRCAQVRAGFSLPVFRLLPENDCSPGFKAV